MKGSFGCCNIQMQVAPAERSIYIYLASKAFGAVPNGVRVPTKPAANWSILVLPIKIAPGARQHRLLSCHKTPLLFFGQARQILGGSLFREVVQHLHWKHMLTMHAALHWDCWQLTLVKLGIH